MSKVSSLYDAIVTRVTAVLPSHKRLSDPYRFLKNKDSEKRQGWGLRVGAGQNPNQQLSCNIILRQQFTILVTRLVAGREIEPNKKAATEKQLLEDLFLIIDDFENDPTLATSGVVIGAQYLSHNGIDFMEAERDDHMVIEASFDFRYQENLN